MSSESNRLTALAALESICRGDWDGFVNDMTADADIWIIGNTAHSGSFKGPRAVLEATAFPLSSQLDGNLSLEIDYVIADERSVAVTAQGRSTLKCGREYNNTYAYFFGFSNGKICRFSEYADTQLLVETFDLDAAETNVTHLSAEIKDRETQNKATVLKFFRRMNESGTAAATELLAEHATWWVPYQPILTKSEVKQQLLQVDAALAEPLKMGIKNIIAEGDVVAAVTVSRGVLREFGKVYSNQYHWLLKLVEGEIVEVQEHNDTQHMAYTWGLGIGQSAERAGARDADTIWKGATLP